jgi:2'-5' RNA ligase
VLHVPVSGLDGVAAAVSAQLQRWGDDDRPFVGPLTVGRARGRRDDVRPLAGLAVPAAAQAPWPVHELTLVASVGGRYEVVHRVPLR